MKKITAFLLTILSVIFIYLTATSIERVPPGEVEVVMEIGVSGTGLVIAPRPLINPGPRGKWFFKQPKIPFLKAGYLKESFKIDEGMDFSTSFAFYTLDEVTGRREDRETVSAITIEGRIDDITDWELFISRLDPDRYNSDDNPYGIKYLDRAEILAQQIKYLIRSSEPSSLYPGLLRDGDQQMTPGLRIDYWYKELISRRNFIVALKDRFNFEREEDYVSFLKNENPWYWRFGIQRYEELLNQAEDLAEYLQSPFSGGLSARGYAGRYLNDEDYLLLVNMIRRTDSWEKDMLNTEQNIANLQKQWDQKLKQARTETSELADLLYQGYMSELKKRNCRITDVRIEEINGDFIEYINAEVAGRLLTAIRKKKLELTIASLDDYRSAVIEKLDLDEQQLKEAEWAADYLKTEYAHYMESDDWEYFTATFSNEINTIFVENPDVRLPEDDVIQMVYFKLLNYYLGQLSVKYEDFEIESSRLLYSLYNILLASPDLLSSSRADMSDQIFDYLMNDDLFIIRTAGALLSLDWNLNYQREQRSRLTELKQSVLVPYFSHTQENEDLIESEELWTAAIRNVLGGPDLSEYRAYRSHEVTDGESLESLAAKYGVDGKDFIMHAYSLISFSNPDDQSQYNYLSSFMAIDDVYQKVKKMPLQSGSLIAFDTLPVYTSAWWEKRSIGQNQREVVIKSFVYPWIDAHLPAAFDEFVSSSPYIDYFQSFFGLRLADMKLFIEERSVFSNPRLRQVDPDFIGVYDN